MSDVGGMLADDASATQQVGPLLAGMPKWACPAEELGCTPAQLALAWVLHQAPHIVTIPGTSRVDHLKDNMAALTIQLSPEVLVRLNQTINQHNVVGNRYNAQASSEVDTEVFGA